MAKLHEIYKDTVVPELFKQFGYTSVMQVPRIVKSHSTWVWVKR